MAYNNFMESFVVNILRSPEWGYLARILVAAICGSFIGLEREKRSKNAGVRTHILVSLASALMMVVSKYGFFDVLSISGIDIDASRVASSVVSAIGFLGAGVIFMKNENTIGVTTAAGLWGTVGIGITIGAGMYITGITCTLLIIILQFLLHSKLMHLGSTQVSGTIILELESEAFTLQDIYALFKAKGLAVKNLRIKKSQEGSQLVANIVFSKKETIQNDIAELKELGTLISLEIATFG